MAKRKLRKPLLLQEEFAAGEVSNPNQNATPAVQTDTNTVGIDKTSTSLSGEEVRAEIVKDVDTILTNLEALSKQITESADNLIMEEDAIAKIFQSMKSGLAIAKCEAKWKKYEEILTMADANMQEATRMKNQLALTTKAEKQFDKLSGSKLEIAKAKVDKAKAKLEATFEYEKERNKNVLSEFEAELTEMEADISKDSVLGKLYFRQKQMIKNQVAEQGVLAKAEMAEKMGNDATAKALKVKLDGLKKKQAELAKEIADGQKDGAEDLKELEGVKAYIKEIEAIQKAASATKKIATEAGTAASGIVESFYATWASENADLLLEGAVADLFSKAKGANDEAALSKAKELAGKLKAAADAEYKAKAALVNKIKGKEVPKTIVILAGGDGDSAKEGENGYTLGEFIPKWGGGPEFVKPEDFGPMKDVEEVEANVDQAIADAKEANKEGGKEKENEKEGEGKFDEEKVQKAIDDAQKEFDGLPKDTEPAAKAKVEVKLLKAKIAMAKGKGEDTADLETELTRATKSLTEKPTMKVKKNEPQDPPQNNSVEIDSDLTAIEEASVSGLQVYDAEDDGYKWFTGTFAKQFNVKVTISDDEPWADTMSVTGKKADILKFVDATGHGDLVGDTEEFPHQIEEGNAFGAARAEAIAKGEKTFKVGDEEYDVEGVDADDKENAEEYAEEEGIATEAVTESASFKMGSIADRFRSLM